MEIKIGEQSINMLFQVKEMDEYKECRKKNKTEQNTKSKRQSRSKEWALRNSNGYLLDN